MKRLVLAWLATALAAAGAAVAVLGLLGGSLTGGSGHVMNQAEVRAALAVAPTPSQPAAPRPSATAARSKVITTPGGTVLASCEGGQVSLRNWSPAQGYSVDDQEAGPADTLKVEFDRDEGEDAEAEVTCRAGTPVTLPR
ncbi:hypothetical protein OIE66_29530 [Nonomuraea sp. NBC_01738]|uniref:hypothetical protein n=1 Tax=Nonomuraea sp. NBC_01738 TaxID=2976003 RepID=UPI002E1247A5|nr:hypothetical protein OIE66_29530 [Nonomuraea sp. NBC_01738]